MSILRDDSSLSSARSSIACSRSTVRSEFSYAAAPTGLTPQQQWDAEVKADPTLGPMWARGQKRVVGGAVLTGIGSIFALISIGAFVIAPGTDEFAGVFWAGGTVTGVIGLVLLIPGSVLIATGVKQRRNVLEAKPRPIARLAPLLLPGMPGMAGRQGMGARPGGGGVSYTLRF